jgi:carboxylate-amine ligase
VIHASVGELARREPTFALHVHVGVADPERAVTLADRLRAHLPMLLALSANSPYWQGRDSGLASARIPIFQAFPRAGMPRAFGSYHRYVEAVDGLVRTGAIPEPTFIWWDVRLQPSLGTVEVRIMDAQTTAEASGALLGLVQTLAHLELEEGYANEDLIHAPEVLAENRFSAARDGIDAEFIDLEAGRLVPARDQLERLIAAARPHAQELGCSDALDHVAELAASGGATWQRQIADRGSLPMLVEKLSDRFV